MKNIKSFKDYNSINEGWKENILAAISLAGSVAYSQPQFKKPINIENKIEMSYSDERPFYSACFQLCEELKTPDLTFDQRRGLVEAQLYFQAKRDGNKTEKLSNVGEAAVKSVMKSIMSMSDNEVMRLSQLGDTGKLTAEFIGK